jgi:hypothetical protein
MIAVGNVDRPETFDNGTAMDALFRLCGQKEIGPQSVRQPGRARPVDLRSPQSLP